MQVSTLLRLLSYGELSNLSIGSDGSGKIEDKYVPKLISYINEGLLQLFTRFNLKESSLVIEQIEHITNYHLRKEFAQSSESDEKYHYIKDLPNSPFQGDVIKILEVVDSGGKVRPLNDKQDPLSLFTPNPNTLQVPKPLNGQGLGVIYQARHRQLSLEGNNAINQDIDIPFFLEKALQSYVASLVYDNMNGQENKINAQGHLVKYEEKCMEVETQDLANNSFHTSFTKLEQRGFV